MLLRFQYIGFNEFLKIFVNIFLFFIIFFEVDIDVNMGFIDD